jgi:hypothetical protein
VKRRGWRKGARDRERIFEQLAATDRLIARTKLRLRKLEASDPPASNSIYWRPKGAQPQEDAPWLEDGWSGKR